jgi:ribonuclease-3
VARLSSFIRNIAEVARNLIGKDYGEEGHVREKLLRGLEKKIGYRFRDVRLLNMALSHRSYTSGMNGNGDVSYERLEFLGDAALGLIVSELLYRENPGFAEGELTRNKSSLVSREALVRCSETLGIEKYILISSRENLLRGRSRAAILADSFEALLGAMYLDGGEAQANALVKRLLTDDAEAMHPFLEFHQAKNRLLRIIQEVYQTQPEYRITKTDGPEHDRVFACEVSVRGRKLGRGYGKSKKESEKRAALDALKGIEEENARI